MTRTRLLAALAAGLVLTGAGTAVALADDPAQPVRTIATTTGAPAAVTDVATGDDAGRLAVRQLGGGPVTKVEQETEHGRPVWEVDVAGATGATRMHVDAATGAVTRVVGDDRAGDDGAAVTGSRDDRARINEPRDDRSGHGRHGADDGPGHDLGDDH